MEREGFRNRPDPFSVRGEEEFLANVTKAAEKYWGKAMMRIAQSRNHRLEQEGKE